MSFGSIETYSEAMRRVMEVRFILPDDKRFMPSAETAENPNYDRPAKTLLLLNGYTHDNLEWLLNTRIFELASAYNLAVILPSGENGFYLNHEGINEHFADFVGDELMQYFHKTFGLSEKREDNFVGGLSMGGFGALHTGLAYSDHFSRIMALSSALIVHEIAGAKPGFVNAGGDYPYYRRIFGDLEQVLTSCNNPEQLILNLQIEGKAIPELYLACGTEDFLLDNNRQFKAFLDEHQVPAEYRESPGIHDYVFWNQYLEPGIQWMVR